MRGETEPLVVQLPNLVIGEVQHLWVLDKFHLTSYLNPLHTTTHVEEFLYTLFPLHLPPLPLPLLSFLCVTIRG